jgi:hypothetical protein
LHRIVSSFSNEPPAGRLPRSVLSGLALVAACALVGCGAPSSRDWARLEEVTPGLLAARHALHPGLASDGHGRVALTFVTAATDSGFDAWIAVSADTGASFGAPVRLNARAAAVAASAEDAPQAAFGPEGRMVVVWAERRAGSARAIDVMAAASGDGGASFSEPAVVNDDAGDARETRHRLPAVAFLTDGTAFAAWTDERENRGDPAPGTTCVFAATSENGGLSWDDNRPITDRACPCCRIAVAVDDSDRVGVAYRSGAGNLRDPALAVTFDRGESVALDTVLVADRWESPDCPGAGLALAAGAGSGRLAWYTGGGTPGVWLAPWRAARGLAGPKRTLMDSLASAAEPRLVRHDATTWIALDGRARADTTRRVLAVRALLPGGRLTPWCFLGAEAEEGAIAAVGPGRALAAWSERGEVRVVGIRRLSPR